jgi:nucleoside-diphosphate-sugar epimerase
MTHYTVIGAAGFVGSHVAARLRAAGIEPSCPERDDPALWEGDLGRIIYCAGLTGDYRTRPFATVEAHVALLARLIEKASFDRIVYLSSTRLYDLLPDGIGKEDRAIPVNPGNAEHLYELSKLLGENLALHRSGGRGVVARLSYVFGWEEDAQGFLSDWLRSARESRSLMLDSSPGFARDYIHVDDVAGALITMADSKATGIVNVARGETLSNAEISVLFKERGWDVSFSREGGSAKRAGAINAAKLAELGATARPVLPLIRQYLGGLR